MDTCQLDRMRQKEEPLLRELNIVNKDSLGIYRKGLSVRTSWSDLRMVCPGIRVCLSRTGPGICVSGHDWPRNMYLGRICPGICVCLGRTGPGICSWVGLAQEYVSG